MTSACDCDTHDALVPLNPPGLPRISARRGDWRTIRRALLAGRASETALAGWQPSDTQDLGVMIAEWWATIGEILEFYNDEIANEGFLATARQDVSVTRLIGLLGYRPRPALAATATLGGILAGQQAITLPMGFAVESIPAPGQQPQTFELDAATTLLPGGRTKAQPAAALASPEAGVLLLDGRVPGIAVGDRLRLRIPGGDRLLSVTAIDPADATPGQTRLRYTADAAIPAGTTARACRIERATQALPLWTFIGSAIVGNDVHLAGLSRAVAAGSPVLVTAPGTPARLATVSAVADVIWYANATNAAHPETSPGANGLPVPHTRLTLASALTGYTAAAVTIYTGWVELGRLVDQPPAAWNGSPATLAAIAPARFSAAIAAPALAASASGPGVPATLNADAGAATGALTVDPAFAGFAPLAAPIDVITNLLMLTRGKSVPHEVIGSGDARIAGQSFVLAKAPVSYRRQGAGYASGVIIRVDGAPWREVASFYGQPADAAIYTLREDEGGKTRVSFGDGVNGRRLPSGGDNVVATYRYGAGAEAPDAARLTRLPAPFPGLAKVLNPVAASGGADAQSASSIRHYAPRSVLTLDRAVSVADFEAFAATAADPDRVRAVWAWDEVRQRTAVTVYIAGGPGKLVDVRTALAAVGDPSRPVSVAAAVPVPLYLLLSLAIAPGYESAPIIAAATEALIGADGLFSPARLGIGQPLFASDISAAVLAVPGVVTLLAARLFAWEYWWWPTELSGALHRVDENQWFDLAPEALSIGTEVAGG